MRKLIAAFAGLVATPINRSSRLGMAYDGPGSSVCA